MAMSSITLPQAQLIKRTAWMNMQIEERRRRGEMQEPEAVTETCAAKARRGLEYVACLNSVAIDLEMELTEAGMFRHAAKRTVREIQQIAARVHQQAWTMLNDYKRGVGRVYDARMESVEAAIDGAILLRAPERAYNIMAALVRLIAGINDELRPYNWDFFYARELAAIGPKLARLGIRDYGVDCIIERAYATH